MTTLFENISSDAKHNAQCNLIGRTHYVDPDTLSFHKARILYSDAHPSGVVFSLIESYAQDYENTSWAVRGVVFDVFGYVLYRGEGSKTRKHAEKDLADFLDTIKPKQVMREATRRAGANHKRNIAFLKEQVGKK